jgi:hypothetical protein
LSIFDVFFIDILHFLQKNTSKYHIKLHILTSFLPPPSSDEQERVNVMASPKVAASKRRVVFISIFLSLLLFALPNSWEHGFGKVAPLVVQF